MSAKRRNRPDEEMGEAGSVESRIPGLHRSSSDHKGKEGGSLFSFSTLSVWAGILLLCVLLAFGYRQMGGWVQGLREELGKVAQDNKLLLEGLDELLARKDAPDRVAEIESSPPIRTALKRDAPETSASNDFPTKYKIYYRMKEGEGLAEICRKFAVSEDQLRLWNALGPADSLIPGQVVVINKETEPEKPTDAAQASPPPAHAGAVTAKGGEPASERAASPEILQYRQAPEDLSSDEGIPEVAGGSVPEGGQATANRALRTPGEPVEEIVHTVEAGQTLSDLGQEFGVPWPILAAYNHITDPETIYEGQRLRIPIDGAQITPAPTNEMNHTVRTGDNLYRIGLKYGVSWELIARRNNIGDSGLLYEGQVLKIPAAMGGPEP